MSATIVTPAVYETTKVLVKEARVELRLSQEEAMELREALRAYGPNHLSACLWLLNRDLPA